MGLIRLQLTGTMDRFLTFKHLLKPVRFIFALIFVLFLGPVLAQDQAGLSAQLERASANVKMQAFPNPATEYVSIKLETARISEVQISLHNIIGNAVEVESEVIDDQEIRFRVKDLPVGYYLVSVREKQGGASGTVKFLKR